MMITTTQRFFVAVFLSLTACAGAVDLTIEHVGREKKYAYVDNQWNMGAECVELKVSVSLDQTSKQVYYRAYLYDKDNRLIHTIAKPSSIFDYDSENKSSPPVLMAGKKYAVYFAIPEEFTRGEKKWKRAVVVFGGEGKVLAEVFPKDSIKLFDFPEKDQLK